MSIVTRRYAPRVNVILTWCVTVPRIGASTGGPGVVTVPMVVPPPVVVVVVAVPVVAVGVVPLPLPPAGAPVVTRRTLSTRGCGGWVMTFIGRLERLILRP